MKKLLIIIRDLVIIGICVLLCYRGANLLWHYKDFVVVGSILDPIIIILINLILPAIALILFENLKNLKNKINKRLVIFVILIMLSVLVLWYLPVQEKYYRYVQSLILSGYYTEYYMECNIFGFPVYEGEEFGEM